MVSRREMPVVRRPQVRLPELTPFQGELRQHGDHDGVQFEELELGGQAAPGTMFLDCGFVRCGLDETSLARARLLDSRLESVSGVGTDLSGAELRDVEVHEPRLGGAQLHGSTLSRVWLRGGKLDFLNFREASLTDVTFEGCVLVEPDFSSATLTRVSFDGCVLRRADLSKARLRDVDLRGAVELDLAGGVDRLSGAVISTVQLTELAPVFAQELGVRVLD